MRINKVLFFIFILNFAFGQDYPPGFQEQSFSSDWETPTGLVFDHAGKMYVFERAGKIYKYENEQKNLLIDISDEVATWGDYGLLSTVLDPNFASNGYIYLFYAVNRHHLLYFGTPEYETEPIQGATICRATRFTLDVTNNFNSLVPNSRHVILGQTKSTGVPCTGINHGGGQMNFAVDGTLLISTGDGSRGADYENQAFLDEIVSQEEFNVVRKYLADYSGQWRSQLRNSLSGKILRIDPSTGYGVASNPFFNSSAPDADSSKVWALGFRNPFRLTIKPGSGSHKQIDGNPGILVVCDVGQDSKEEINVVTQAGQNFGWPHLEGIDHVFFDDNTALIPANPKKPTIEWGRDTQVPARIVVDGQIFNYGSVEYPDTSFTGKASIGGVFYEGQDFPEEYHEAYFFADFDSYWVKSVVFDANNNPISRQDFSAFLPGLISFTYNPFDKSMYYTTNSKVARFFYAPGGNQPPVARFTHNPIFGSSPLIVNFDASSSTDPENVALTYLWDFGDNTTSTLPNPSHTFTSLSSAPQSFDVVLTVTDNMGVTNSISKKVSLNNTPPQIISTSLDNLTKFSTSGNPTINLFAVVQDAEEPNRALRYKWQVFLYHNNHSHPEFSGTLLSQNVILGTIPCDDNLYFYRFVLTVEDSYGLVTVFHKDLYPNCNTSDLLAPELPLLRADSFSQNKFELNWNRIIDDYGIRNIEVFVNGISRIILSASSIKYVHSSSSILTGQNFSAYIIARDFGGNSITSPKIYFQVPSNTCNSTLSTIYLSNLSPSSESGFGVPLKNDFSYDNRFITLDGVVYPKGLGMHATSDVTYDISSLNYSTFSAKIGIDDEINFNNYGGSVIFKIFKDNSLVYTSPIMTAFDTTIDVSMNVLNANLLRLEVNETSDGNIADHADWADAKLTGPCPSLDLIAPSNPLNFTITRLGNNVELNWSAAVDNLDANIDYDIFIDGILFATTNTTVFHISSFPLGIHIVTIQARDNFGNVAVTKSLEINFNLCPPTNILSNTNAFLIQNQNTFYKASVSISAANQIINSSNVLFQAARNIELLPGFFIENGSVFTAKIAGCLD